MALRPVLQPALERTFKTGSPFGRQLVGVDMARLLKIGRALVEERPLTSAELRPILHKRWPKRDQDALVMATSYLLPRRAGPAARGLGRQRAVPSHHA